MPNLRWGQRSFRKLAQYNFHNDTITVSSIFRDVDEKVLDYIMYHEMLHKYIQFEQKNGRSTFHTRQFREMEWMYPGYKDIEKEINRIIRKNQLTTAQRWWWQKR
jgi:predicted metal-dependent hydrolase